MDSELLRALRQTREALLEAVEHLDADYGETNPDGTHQTSEPCRWSHLHKAVYDAGLLLRTLDRGTE